MSFPMNAAKYNLDKPITLFINKGKEVSVNGDATTVTGLPSNQLLPSTNTVQGYFTGQMLATASGVKADSTPSGLIAGAMINFNPSSLDTGQQVWNGKIVNFDSTTLPMPLKNPDGSPYVPPAMNCSVPAGGWTIRQQYLYANSTPELDVDVVKAALEAWTGTITFTTIQNM